ncbi:FAD-dependent oxidoreductase [Paenibacillus frigoriresistens]|uniref:FAD-dependent oxidoreductase n=1 Tax=Paenibacillus alginolyticus TaxID=59839 RepID=UPI001565439F|nr:FAD-dependent oxidoreductase [Paenibacillus frigoriresistens]NRF95639.1 FAD-dependent oxidoreductase [Paenibacillus frigoriresistens]
MNNIISSSRKAIIIGAGIGGLTTALFLQRQGWEVVIYEKKRELSEFGAGIVLAANAMHILSELGLAEQVREAGAQVGMAEIRSWDGKPITSVPVSKQAAKYGTYSYLIHRAKLQKILFQQLNEFSTVYLNKKLIAFEQDPHQVVVHFDDGTEDKGHILIGADGIHSQVAHLLFGLKQLRYSGFKAFRGITSFLDKRYMPEIGGGFEAWGRGRRFGFSQLGEGQVFWFAAINSDSGTVVDCKKDYVLQQFEGWHNPIERAIQLTDEGAILTHDIHDRIPLERWSQGRATLLGDAAHPMLPNLGQGGAQAMEDALVVARCLEGISILSLSSVTAALHSYESNRKARTNQVVRQSRRMARIVQMSNPAAIMLRNQVLRVLPDEVQMKQLDWLLGYRV